MSTTNPNAPPATQYAAVDLGSNSFHMVVAAADEGGRLSVVDRIKESVRLAAGLDADGAISAEAEERAMACLARFGERLSEMPGAHVRVVGTNTLRRARNAVDFLERAQSAVGHRIDVISGREEARLIYRGVSRDVDKSGRLLVMDIGGGSTELIVGEDNFPIQLDSLFMGCVSWSERFFPKGKVTASAMEEAIMAARRELQSVVRSYRKAGWTTAVGSSGTINAIERILLAEGHDGVRPEGLAWLRDRLIDVGDTRAMSLTGLSSDRRPVLPGGTAILSALFTGLRIKRLRATPHALREGVLLELVGREHERDIRDDTVRRIMDAFDVDGRQAFHVQQTAVQLFQSCAKPWKLRKRHRNLLRWSAALHEVGMFLTYAGYHKHGAYLLTYREMPGFSRQEQRRIATLVLGHRGQPSIDTLTNVALLMNPRLLRLIALLRISVRIHRRRSPRPPPELVVDLKGDVLRLRFPSGWLEDRPLTRGDLEADKAYLAQLGVQLALN